MSEEYIEEGINGQWTDWKFEAENYKKIYEHLYQENKQLKEVIKEVRELLGHFECGQVCECTKDLSIHVLQILDKAGDIDEKKN